MQAIEKFIEDLKEKAEKRFDDFHVEELDTISDIKSDAYLSRPTWLGGDKKFVCLSIDLDKSSRTSFKRHPETMAKIYDYFTQTIVDVYSYTDFAADYIDVKGDGAFAIYEGKYASYKAFYAAMTFRQIFEEKIKTQFKDSENNNLGCKLGIHKDVALVKKIGKPDHYNEVWAGRLINNAAKLAKEFERNRSVFNGIASPIVISKSVYLDFEANPEFGLYYCHENGQEVLEQKKPVFIEVPNPSDETLGDEFYYAKTTWCKQCADSYINKIKDT